MNTQESQGNDLLLNSNRTGTKTVMHLLHSPSWPDLKSTAIVLVVVLFHLLILCYVGVDEKCDCPIFQSSPHYHPVIDHNTALFHFWTYLSSSRVPALLLTSLWPTRRSTRNSSIITRCSVYLDTIHWMCNSISVHPSIATTAHHSREHSSPIHIQAKPLTKFSV